MSLVDSRDSRFHHYGLGAATPPRGNAAAEGYPSPPSNLIALSAANWDVGVAGTSFAQLIY